MQYTWLHFACRVVMAVAFSAMSIGRFNSLGPDYGNARSAANRIFALYDVEPSIDPTSNHGHRSVIDSCCSLVLRHMHDACGTCVMHALMNQIACSDIFIWMQYMMEKLD